MFGLLQYLIGQWDLWCQWKRNWRRERTCTSLKADPDWGISCWIWRYVWHCACLELFAIMMLIWHLHCNIQVSTVTVITGVLWFGFLQLTNPWWSSRGPNQPPSHLYDGQCAPCAALMNWIAQSDLLNERVRSFYLVRSHFHLGSNNFFWGKALTTVLCVYQYVVLSHNTSNCEFLWQRNVNLRIHPLI